MSAADRLVDKTLQALIAERDRTRQQLTAMKAHYEALRLDHERMERLIEAMQEFARTARPSPTPKRAGHHTGNGVILTPAPGSMSARILEVIRAKAGENVTATEIASEIGALPKIVAMQLTRIQDPHLERIGEKWFRWNEAPAADCIERAGLSIQASVA